MIQLENLNKFKNNLVIIESGNESLPPMSTITSLRITAIIMFYLLPSHLIQTRSDINLHCATHIPIQGKIVNKIQSQREGQFDFPFQMPNLHGQVGGESWRHRDKRDTGEEYPGQEAGHGDHHGPGGGGGHDHGQGGQGGQEENRPRDGQISSWGVTSLICCPGSDGLSCIETQSSPGIAREVDIQSYSHDES